MLTVKRLVGDTEIAFTSDSGSLKEDIVHCSWLLNAPNKCGLCGGTDIALQGRITGEGEYTYDEFVCKGCFAKAQLGEYKSPKGALFVKNEWKKWEKKAE